MFWEIHFNEHLIWQSIKSKKHKNFDSVNNDETTVFLLVGIKIYWLNKKKQQIMKSQRKIQCQKFEDYWIAAFWLCQCSFDGLKCKDNLVIN